MTEDGVDDCSVDLILRILSKKNLQKVFPRSVLFVQSGRTATEDLCNIGIVIHHIQGKKNVIADCLSRLHSCNHIYPILLTHLENNYVWDHINNRNFSLNLTI